MLVSRARMSTLFALVKTHNCLIYISFPPQNRKPLCAPTFCFPSPPTTTIRVITQSASELHVANGKGSHESSWGSWTVTDRETTRGVWDAQTGSLRKRIFPVGQVSLEIPRRCRIVFLCINTTRAQIKEHHKPFWCQSHTVVFVCYRYEILHLLNTY